MCYRSQHRNFVDVDGIVICYQTEKFGKNHLLLFKENFPQFTLFQLRELQYYSVKTAQ